MEKLKTFGQPTSIRGWRFLLAVLLVLGVFFRFANLEGKLYWHDEVYSSIRAAGYTRQEIDSEIFQNRIIAPRELQKFQQIKPGSTAANTISSLATEDPQHPPLYFLMARFWMQTFGSSITASRSLSVLLSLLALPLMYGLGLELFGSRLVAMLATLLLALSPFDILFAQVVRQYSLLTVMVIGSNLLLLRALRLQAWQNWVLYSLGSTAGLYTHPLFGLTLIAQGTYVLLLSLPFGLPLRWEGWWRQSDRVWKYLLAIGGALILYAPWLVVMQTNFQRLSNTTDWTRVSEDFLYLARFWILSFTCHFFDLDVGFDNIWTYLLRLPIVVLEVVAIYTVCRQMRRATWLFILTIAFVPFLMLALPDLLLGGKRSTITRYLISCYPAIQLAVAYFLANQLQVSRWLSRSAIVLLVTGSIASCSVSAFSDTWWHNIPSYYNAAVARIINAEAMRGTRTNPTLVVSDMGDYFINTGDLISLSYLLHQNVQLLLPSQPPNLKPLQGYSEALVFRPSKQLCDALEGEKRHLEVVFFPGGLWRLRQNGNGSDRLDASSRLRCTSH